MKSVRYCFPIAVGMVFLAFIAWLHAGCSKNNPEENQPVGHASIRVGISVAVSQVYNSLKAAEPDEFVVAIYAESGNEVMRFPRAADMPVSVDLPEGNYYAAAWSDNNVPAAFDNDYYYGESEIFSIVAGETTQVSFTCVLANIRVTVVYAASVTEDFDTYVTTVSNAEGSLVFSEDEIRAGYFNAGPLTIQAVLGYTDGSGAVQSMTLDGLIQSPEAGKHYEILIDAALSDGYGAIAFEVDESYETETVMLGDEPANDMSGELLITEIMYNPSAIGDAEGEFIELLNVSDAVVNLNGLVIRRGSNNSLHVIAEDLPLLPQQYALLANGEAATDHVDYVYSSISLVNSGEEIIINTYGTDGTDGDVICRVDYGAAGFPAGLNGSSIQLSDGITDVNEAMTGTNWCASTIAYNTGDLGTPGTVNSPCP